MTTWLCPTPDPSIPLPEWSPVLLLASTILGEAEGESDEGKRAVADCIMNRVREKRWPDDVNGVCLQPRQFSCFDDERRLKVMKRPKRFVKEEIWNACFWAACDAIREDAPKFIGPANHYLAEAQLRAAGMLPSWWDPEKVTVRIGAHAFLAL